MSEDSRKNTLVSARGIAGLPDVIRQLHAEIDEGVSDSVEISDTAIDALDVRVDALEAAPQGLTALDLVWEEDFVQLSPSEDPIFATGNGHKLTVTINATGSAVFASDANAGPAEFGDPLGEITLTAPAAADTATVASTTQIHSLESGPSPFPDMTMTVRFGLTAAQDADSIAAVGIATTTSYSGTPRGMWFLSNGLGQPVRYVVRTDGSEDPGEENDTWAQVWLSDDTWSQHRWMRVVATDSMATHTVQTSDDGDTWTTVGVCTIAPSEASDFERDLYFMAHVASVDDSVSTPTLVVDYFKLETTVVREDGAPLTAGQFITLEILSVVPDPFAADETPAVTVRILDQDAAQFPTGLATVYIYSLDTTNVNLGSAIYLGADTEVTLLGIDVADLGAVDLYAVMPDAPAQGYWATPGTTNPLLDAESAIFRTPASVAFPVTITAP